MSEEDFTWIEKSTGKLLALLVISTGRITKTIFKYVLDFLYKLLDTL